MQSRTSYSAMRGYVIGQMKCRKLHIVCDMNFAGIHKFIKRLDYQFLAPSYAKKI